MRRRINKAGCDLIRSAEGCKLKAYPDPGSGGDPWTIGYGSTYDVKPGMAITQDQAEGRLINDLRRFEDGVAALMHEPSDNEFSACVSLAFNIGLGNFEHSSVLRRHNAGDKVGAARAFEMWDRSAGRVMLGLVKRRAAEAALYSKA